jgi:hypothetical protein
VLGEHPHFFESPPPPHVIGAGHCPQRIVPPQPSGALPHSAPRSSHVMGTQPGPPPLIGPASGAAVAPPAPPDPAGASIADER